jgi:hypothetical protein
MIPSFPSLTDLQFNKVKIIESIVSIKLSFFKHNVFKVVLLVIVSGGNAEK